jgi:hypothetical protein
MGRPSGGQSPSILPASAAMTSVPAVAASVSRTAMDTKSVEEILEQAADLKKKILQLQEHL